jgi:hypothetical protein
LVILHFIPAGVQAACSLFPPSKVLNHFEYNPCWTNEFPEQHVPVEEVLLLKHNNCI